MKLPKILIHHGNGDASFLIDGYKMPPGTVIGANYSAEGDGEIVRVNITLFASEVTIIDPKEPAA